MERPLGSVRPSQLYIDAAALRDVLCWFDPDVPAYDPLPVWEHRGTLVLLDGHTRALAAHLCGQETLLVTRERPPTPRIYRDCLGWCTEAGVTAVPDLIGRVVSPDAFRARWVARCHASPGYPGGQRVDPDLPVFPPDGDARS